MLEFRILRAQERYTQVGRWQGCWGSMHWSEGLRGCRGCKGLTRPRSKGMLGDERGRVPGCWDASDPKRWRRFRMWIKMRGGDERCPEMEFLDISLTKDLSLWLHATYTYSQSLSTGGFYRKP